MTAATQPEAGQIYFVRVGDKIKIGHSVNVHGRVENLRTGSPEPLVLLATIDGPMREEKLLHKRFAHLRVYREWFLATDELLAYIEQNGTPAQTAVTQARVRRSRPFFDEAAYRQQLRDLVVPEVDEWIAAAVAEAPPLPEDLEARLKVLIRSVEGRTGDDAARREAAARRYEAKIAAAVAEAPPLPEDLAARLTVLIRSVEGAR